ncbi:hypothetical protein D9M68_830080 [compost metagenome]
MVLLHQAQAEVHAGGNTGRAVEAPVAHEQRVFLHQQFREQPLQQRGILPVGDHGTAIQQSGLRQQKSSRAHRTAARHPGHRLREPARQPALSHRPLHAVASGHQQGAAGQVGRFRQGLGHQLEPGAGTHQPALGGDALQPIGRSRRPWQVLGHGGEHLRRAAGIQQLEIGEHQQHHAMGLRHGELP